MNAGKEQVWADYFASAKAAVIDNDSEEAKASRAAHREKVKGDPEAQAATKQFVSGVFAKHDKNGNGFLEQDEFLAFAKEMMATGNAKHGGDRTLPDDIVNQGWTICRECFGDEANPGIALADFGKMMHAAGNP